MLEAGCSQDWLPHKAERPGLENPAEGLWIAEEISERAGGLDWKGAP